MKILGIETSCDESAVAIVTEDREILSHNVYSQIKQHKEYGGVVPEIAARSHIEVLDSLIVKSMQEAGVKDFKDLDAIAVTSGPGLIGGVIVGVMQAKGIAYSAKLPIIGVNHLEGHALTIRLVDEQVKFPFLLLLMSGGHCQFLSVKEVGKYEKLGGTIDDAIGESFDKVAKMLKLGYPGGPIIEKYAKEGNPNKYEFPRSLKGRNNCDFSFSGLKTAVKRQVDSIEAITEQDKKDICASFQFCVAEIISDRLSKAFKIFKQGNDSNVFVIAGGVAANQYLRDVIENTAKRNGFEMKVAPRELCTDNGAMIAWAGIERFKKGYIDHYNLVPKAKWPLDSI